MAQLSELSVLPWVDINKFYLSLNRGSRFFS